MGIIQSVLAFLVTLGILVTIHEFGHYLVARWSGVRILRFSVGFGKPFASWTDKRGTEFAVAAIPLGGYLRMWDERDPLGEHTDGGDAIGKSHNSLTPLWRIAIAFGGPLANFILACFLFWALFVAGTNAPMPLLGEPFPDSPAAAAGMRSGEEIVAVDGQAVVGWQAISMRLLDRLGESGTIGISTRRPGGTSTTDYELAISNWQHGEKEPEIWRSLGLNRKEPAVVGSLSPGEAAERAGLKVHDLVVGAGGNVITDWNDWVEAIRAHPEQPLELDIERAGSARRITIVPGARTDENGAVHGFAGVGYAFHEVRHGPIAAVGLALAETRDNTLHILSTLKKMLTGAVSTRNLSGPITIAEVAGITVEQGWQRWVGLLALLSLSLAVLNLLPVPMLDGGQIVFFTAELLRGKPLSDRVQVIGFQIGIILVGGLMVLALSNDITRLLERL